MSSLNGKNIIITGATSGIGSKIAALLSSEGADVFIGGRRADRGEAVAEETNTTFHVLDVADEESNRKFFDAASNHFGGTKTVDFVLLNAGVEGNNAEAQVSNLSVSNYDYIYSVNVRGVILGMKYGIETLTDGGSILVTSSTVSIMTMGASPIYASSKAAVDSLVRSFAEQFAKSDDERIKSLSILSMNPTLYETDMADRFTGGEKTMLEGFAKMVNPSQRPGLTSELATIVRDYIHGDLPYKSGDTFAVDADTHFPLSEYFDRMNTAAKATA
mmetsp:Transcript_61109/g.149616  ORF Transcript_61109/g.149616 Transcript_61109/m.149616 type:complete len:274 (+) Transcript_61109:364-1185(+)|eukprot:CAMPEP_0113466560 /NCGR_PEP_ID=MMETSP0014_2-20120614/14337_1 /TAXON_ID=2857 /ORGANISM="Nitzschia sp." /LENGTH=273 /DNA_ID=CAMNT_0000358791 /DNA_START=269 /DNA_END=1090 /DNA_ORIENTATION=+ /assembly_acc=CAM_ASM_000159